ncbi:MAG: CpsD/CapB family tyrosine-protein kinase [Syntrophomonadaceae bacterium]|nr:CpsD/CapB family tyrosine-protein kinase [Syntrophomonadaceae bacterium]
MKSLLLLSPHPRQGKTTIGVNLAVGLTRLGYKTLLLECGDPSLLRLWFDLPQDSQGVQHPRPEMGIDLLLISDYSYELDRLASYDCIVIDTSEDYIQYKQLIDQATLIAACTDLRADDAHDIPALEQEISRVRSRQPAIDIIIPNIINTKEWSHNSQVLFNLMDSWGEDRIADMIPK